ncbi:actin cortical patch SUR7/pH-response regulator pali [Phanerochaete sordida]|uniref:Actin cortical patch SUR7/pH-response regulator pali n=1 Tax=Phanerochaete sordida TaxID=48140 RepID=A0A9P3G3Z4_9APHY|nr:actin cortical patch SUR7/pH-response regulator pali [Phanerochaete sordida]
MLWIVAPVLAFAAFLLLLLASLSVPITHSIYLIRLTGHTAIPYLDASATSAVRFGVWGYCITAFDLSLGNVHDDTPGFCSPPRLGYKFDSTVQAALNANGVNVKAMNRSLTALLVLHPITCGFAFLTLLLSLSVVRRHGAISRGASFLTFTVGLFASLLTGFLFTLDVVFVAISMHDVKKNTNGQVTGAFGAVTWMVLAAALLLKGALVSTCVTLARTKRKPRGVRY